MFETSFIESPGRKHRIRVPRHMIQRQITPRKNASKRLWSSKWRDLRSWALVDRKYICEECGNDAHHVHHIQPVSEAPERELDPKNLKVLCAGCHRSIHKELPTKMFKQ